MVGVTTRWRLCDKPVWVTDSCKAWSVWPQDDVDLTLETTREPASEGGAKNTKEGQAKTKIQSWVFANKCYMIYFTLKLFCKSDGYRFKLVIS